MSLCDAADQLERTKSVEAEATVGAENRRTFLLDGFCDFLCIAVTLCSVSIEQKILRNEKVCFILQSIGIIKNRTILKSTDIMCAVMIQSVVSKFMKANNVPCPLRKV